jgi:hypothetical protein
MTEAVRDRRLWDLEIRLLKLAEHLTQTVVTAASEQASHVSSALRPVTNAMSLVREAKHAPPEISNRLLREAKGNLSQGLAPLEIARAGAALSELISIQDDLESLLAA